MRRTRTDGGTGFADLDWRIVDDERRPEPENHGIDAALLDRVDAGTAPPTLRIWGRTDRAALIGRFQSYEDEVAAEYVDRNDVRVVRRETGGGAVYVEPDGVLTYSLVAPRSALPDDVAAGFERCNAWVVEALRDLGVDAAHEPLNDIVHPDGKIAGSAQLRHEGAVLHHAVLTHTLDIEEMLRVLSIGAEKVSDKAVESAEKRVAPIGRYVSASPGDVEDRLRTHFRDRFGGHVGTLSEEELRAARRRVTDRFGTGGWTRSL